MQSIIADAISLQLATYSIQRAREYARCLSAELPGGPVYCPFLFQSGDGHTIYETLQKENAQELGTGLTLFKPRRGLIVLLDIHVRSGAQ